MTGVATEGVSRWYTTPLLVCERGAVAEEWVSHGYTTTLPFVRRRIAAANCLVNAPVCRRRPRSVQPKEGIGASPTGTPRVAVDWVPLVSAGGKFRRLVLHVDRTRIYHTGTPRVNIDWVPEVKGCNTRRRITALSGPMAAAAAAAAAVPIAAALHVDRVSATHTGAPRVDIDWVPLVGGSHAHRRVVAHPRGVPKGIPLLVTAGPHAARKTGVGGDVGQAHQYGEAP